MAGSGGSNVPAGAVFDTAFHCTLPDVAAQYAIAYGLSNRPFAAMASTAYPIATSLVHLIRAGVRSSRVSADIVLSALKTTWLGQPSVFRSSNGHEVTFD